MSSLGTPLRTARAARSSGPATCKLGVDAFDEGRPPAPPGHRRRDLERITEKPREVLSYAAYLIEAARERAERLPFAEVMIADLESHLEPASSAWQAVHLERVALKSKQRDVRSKGLALQRAVRQLRAVLVPKLGPDHPDCLVLKVARMRASAEDDDVDETAAASQGNGAAVPATHSSG